MYDVAVIGAGMLGAASAYRLACAGRRVLLIEAAEPASGATGNSFAWLNAVSKEPEAYHRLNADGILEYQGLAEDLGVDIGLRWAGTFQWGTSDADQTALRARVLRLSERGYPAEWIDREAALQLEPSLAIDPAVDGLASYPGDGWVDAPRLARAFVNRALAEGAELWRGARVHGVRQEGGRVTGVETDRGAVVSEQVLLCAGTGTPALLASAGVRLPVGRAPGLLAVTSPVAARPDRVIYAPGVHLRPDVEGGLRIGADDIDSLAEEGTPPTSLPDLARPLLERARLVVPAARNAAIVRVHLGIRPMPEDGHTIAGPVPGLANVWMLVTHSGITMGPLLGRLIAEAMTGGTMDSRLAPFRPDRFQT